MIPHFPALCRGDTLTLTEIAAHALAGGSQTEINRVLASSSHPTQPRGPSGPLHPPHPSPGLTILPS